MLNICIRTIPHREQRYPTVGDWYKIDGVTHIRVSRMEAGETNSWSPFMN